ncbi:hypothetical protein [Mastigocoleus testarum]|uniref:Uncharacterized protein n=1 Tax=Mastigocoleus testarum BC008 TaxID=371196 RepID=A0A0V7ZEB4_9CYAN|nr:hypothetical protein [Mastigocoleus testarum]KST62819.1 hypothetical protein BC008_10860 [Mastigocoleus testarum BC008]KST62871.1 hypothetical protein BC008_11145 [Mastigocoleus testarum BC008]
MSEILANPTVQELVTNLAAGEINLTTGLVWLILAALVSLTGGAIGGMILAGKDLGYKFSAILGGIFGTASVIPATLVGLFVLNFLADL